MSRSQRTDHIVTYTTISAYVGIAFFLNSVLDIWYVDTSYPTAELARFGLNYPPINYQLPIQYGYAGAVAAGIFAAIATRIYLHRYLPALHELRLDDLLPPTASMLLLVSALLLGAQFLGGASWSKLLLDMTVIFTAFLVLLTYIRSFSLFDILFTMYMPLAFGLLTAGLAWANVVSTYTTPTASHFVFALVSFAIRAAFITLVSFLLVLYNTREVAGAQTTIDDFLE